MKAADTCNQRGQVKGCEGAESAAVPFHSHLLGAGSFDSSNFVKESRKSPRPNMLMLYSANPTVKAFFAIAKDSHTNQNSFLSPPPSGT